MDDRLWAEYLALKDVDVGDDGVSGTPEGDYYWRLTHQNQGSGMSAERKIVIDRNDHGDLYIVEKDPEYGYAQVHIQREELKDFVVRLKAMTDELLAEQRPFMGAGGADLTQGLSAKP